MTKTQLKERLSQKQGKRIGRFLCSRKAVNISSGELVGGNVIYHPVYWDKTEEFFEKALEYLSLNNPGLKFRIDYSKAN